MNMPIGDAVDDDAADSLAHEYDSSGDYEPKSTETDSSSGNDFVEDRGVLAIDGYPKFVALMTCANVDGTLEIPYMFWQRHVRMAALQAPLKFMVEGRASLKHNSSKIWVKHGWRWFKAAHHLVEGVVCHFTLVDADYNTFNVWFERP